MTKVLIVDDHESMRETLEKTLCAIEGFTVVASIASPLGRSSPTIS